MAESVSVLFLSEVCARLRISLTTAKRLRRAGAFPIAELRALDRRARYSSADLDAYLQRRDSAARRGRR